MFSVEGERFKSTKEPPALKVISLLPVEDDVDGDDSNDRAFEDKVSTADIPSLSLAAALLLEEALLLLLLLLLLLPLLLGPSWNIIDPREPTTTTTRMAAQHRRVE